MNSEIYNSNERILIMTAVSVEREAVLKGLNGDNRFEVMLAGVGPIAAAANTARLLAKNQYDLVISAGIGGGFPGKAEVGSLVVADEIIVADLGVETAEGFASVDELGFGSSRVHVDKGLVERITKALIGAKLPVRTGPILTVSTATGTAESAGKLAARVPGAVVEGMEGYGVALAAEQCGLPILELRAISNAVGPRDRGAWKIQEALESLKSACSVLSEVL